MAPQKGNAMTETYKPVNNKGFIHPSKVRSYFQPRDKTEFDAQELMAAFHDTNGCQKVEGMVWQPTLENGKVDLNHPAWTSPECRNNYTQEPLPVPMDERETTYFIVCSHRRNWCLQDIHNCKGDYTHEMWENAQKYFVRIVVCSEKRAAMLARDQGESAELSRWNLVSDVCKLLDQYSWEEVAMKNAKDLYKKFSTIARYHAIVRNPANRDYKARYTAITGTSGGSLRNLMYAWIGAAHKMGLAEQLVLTFRFEKNPTIKPEEEKDFLKWVINCQRTNISELHKVYTQYGGSDQPAWIPVERVEITNKPEKGEDTLCEACPDDHQGYFVIKGGPKNFQQALLKLMKMKITGVADKPEPKRLTAKKATQVEQSHKSGLGKSSCAAVNRGENAEIKGLHLKVGMHRLQWEGWGQVKEANDQMLLDERSKCVEPIQEFIDIITSKTAPQETAKRLKVAIEKINTLVKKGLAAKPPRKSAAK